MTYHLCTLVVRTLFLHLQPAHPMKVDWALWFTQPALPTRWHRSIMSHQVSCPVPPNLGPTTHIHSKSRFTNFSLFRKAIFRSGTTEATVECREIKYIPDKTASLQNCGSDVGLTLGYSEANKSVITLASKTYQQSVPATEAHKTGVRGSQC